MGIRSCSTPSGPLTVCCKLSADRCIRRSTDWSAKGGSWPSGSPAGKDLKREFKYYHLTTAGKKRLAAEESKWKKLTGRLPG